MNHEPLVIERTYNAPVEKVWKAITDKEQMKEWYFDIADFKAEKGFEFSFYGGDEKGERFLHLCRIMEVIPNKKLKHSWRYDGHEGDSFVTFELFDEDGKTRVKLTHEGLETFPAIPSFAKKNFVAGWTQIIGTSLKDFVEK
jgi:uncharacterized protein YndB with AHSA1/START domain